MVKSQDNKNEKFWISQATLSVTIAPIGQKQLQSSFLTRVLRHIKFKSMTKLFLKLNFLLALFSFIFLTACTDENQVLEDTDVDSFVETSVEAIDRSGNTGRGGCYELVFPVTVVLPDSTTTEVSSYEEMKEVLREWKESNPGRCNHPSIEFPIDVIDEEGNVITVESPRELRVLRMECRRDSTRGDRGKHCFKMVFPLSIELPDSTVVEVQDRRELKQAIRRWRSSNPGSTERPSLVFPITVELEDGTQVVVEDKDALAALKEECAP